MTIFHHQILLRLGLQHRVDDPTLRRLEQRERELGVTLPQSFVEWFARADGISLLSEYSNCDRPLAIEELGAPIRHGGISERSWPHEPVLPFMFENQGVCVWGIRLDQGPDPAVVVAVDPAFEWRTQSTHFSTFIACQVHDFRDVYGPELALLCSHDVPVEESTLERLRALCEEGPRSHGWPGDEQRRFSMGDVAILIWSSEYQSDWSLASSNEESLSRAVQLFAREGVLPEDCTG